MQKKAKKMKKLQRHCPNCGAPANSEICSYCGSKTGIDSAAAYMEYPVIDCNEVIIEPDEIKFDLILGGIFASLGLGLMGYDILVCKCVFMTIFGLPFAAVGVGTCISPLRKYLRYLTVKKRGKVIPAVVYGYLDDDVIINDRPSQIVKLLIETPEGPRFILYQLYSTVKPFMVNAKVELIERKGRYLLETKVSRGL